MFPETTIFFLRLIVDYKNTRYLSVNSPELFFGLFRVRVKVRVRVRVRVRVWVGIRVRVNSVTETNYQNRKIIRVINGQVPTPL